MTFVVDTNVAVVANGGDWLDKAPACVSACLRIIQGIMESECVAVDDAWLIIGEYRKNLNDSGEPGFGDKFLKWILTNLRSERCCFVRMRDFPNHPSLVKFDPNDRKFVQVALGHNELPPILQATDSKWRGFETALREHAVTIRFLCA